MSGYDSVARDTQWDGSVARDTQRGGAAARDTQRGGAVARDTQRGGGIRRCACVSRLQTTVIVAQPNCC